MVEQFGTVAYYGSILRNPSLDAYAGNKGYDAACTAIEMINLYKSMN